jgi:F0F1-type ATP synthase membrane subunit b/b'
MFIMAQRPRPPNFSDGVLPPEKRQELARGHLNDLSEEWSGQPRSDRSAQAAGARDAAGKVTRPDLVDDELDPPVIPSPGDATQRNMGGTSVEGPRGDPSPPDAPRRGRATVEGQVRGIQQRTESIGQSSSTMVWTFRIERYDHDGNRLPPIPVQMRSIAFEGSLSEGDEVEITGVWKDGTLHTEDVQNLTTGATVKKKSSSSLGCLLGAVFLVIMIAGFITFVVYAQDSFQQQVDKQDQNYQQNVDRMNQDHQREVDKQNQDYQQQVDKQKQDYQQQVDRQKQDYPQQVDKQKQDYQQQVDKQNQDYQQQVDRQEQDYQQRVGKQNQEWCQQAKEVGTTPPGCS